CTLSRLINDPLSTSLEQRYEAKIKLLRIAGMRLDNLEVTASYPPGDVGYCQDARLNARTLRFDVIDTRATRRMAR
ncbi:MAG: hypothetical protein WA733_02395, partial [Methylocystis sp.]